MFFSRKSELTQQFHVKMPLSDIFLQAVFFVNSFVLSKKAETFMLLEKKLVNISAQ